MNDSTQEIVLFRLRAARETLVEARAMLDGGHPRGCINRLYYACFYAVSALLLAKGLSSSKHTGVRAFFNKEFIHTGVFSASIGDTYNTLFVKRMSSDYEDFFTPNSQEVSELFSEAGQLVDTIDGYLQRNTE